jgi:hypothetical protein
MITQEQLDDVFARLREAANERRIIDCGSMPAREVKAVGSKADFDRLFKVVAKVQPRGKKKP